MFNVNKIYFYIVFLSLITLFSCKKDVDEKGPEIKFNSPTENQTFNVYDYVTVNATVTDDVKISSVAVSLLDVNQNYAHTTLPVTVSSPSMTLKAGARFRRRGCRPAGIARKCATALR